MAEGGEDPPRMMAVVHRISPHEPWAEAHAFENVDNIRRREPRDSIAGMLALECKPKSDGESRRTRACRLRHGHPAPGDPCHLDQSRVRPFQVMKPVMHEDQVEGLIGKWQALDVRDDRGDVETVTTSPKQCSSCRPEGQIAGDDTRPRPGEELGVHS